LTTVEVYRQEHWGKPSAVNKAFTYAKGKYIKFLDADDWLIEGSLTRQFKLAESTSADVVVAGYKNYNDDGFLSDNVWVNCDDFIAQNLGECDSSHYSAFLFRHEFIKDIPHRTSFAAANFASRDDRCFMLEVALKEPKIVTMTTVELCHLHHTKDRLQFKSGLSSTCTNFQHLLIYQNILTQLKQSNRLTERRIDAALNILWPLIKWIAKESLDEANKVLTWIYELKPNFKIPDKHFVGGLYKTLGFSNTEKLLRMRRFFKYGWK